MRDGAYRVTNVCMQRTLLWQNGAMNFRLFLVILVFGALLVVLLVPEESLIGADQAAFDSIYPVPPAPYSSSPRLNSQQSPPSTRRDSRPIAASSPAARVDERSGYMLAR